MPLASAQSDSTTNLISIASALPVIVLLIIARVKGKPLKRVAAVISPLVLCAAGVALCVVYLHFVPTKLHRADYIFVVIDVLNAVILGTIRGFLVKIYYRDGARWYRYGWAALTLWLATFGFRVILTIAGSGFHITELIENTDLVFMLGLTLLCQNLVLVSRACRTAQAPPALTSTPRISQAQ